MIRSMVAGMNCIRGPFGVADFDKALLTASILTCWVDIVVGGGGGGGGVTCARRRGSTAFSTRSCWVSGFGERERGVMGDGTGATGEGSKRVIGLGWGT